MADYGTAYIAYINYTIYFSIEVDYLAAKALNAGSDILDMTPSDAATMFGITIWDRGWRDGDPNKGLGDRGMLGADGLRPYPIVVGPPGPGVAVEQVDLLPVIVYSNVLVTVAPPNPHHYGYFPLGRSVAFKWAGRLAFTPYNDGTGSTPPDDPTPIPQRRWIGGLELQPNGEGGTGISSGSLCRDASRTIEGKGLAIRGGNTFSGWTRTVAEYSAGYTPRTSWERIYLRPRAYPSADAGIWRCRGVVSALGGGALKVSTTGELKVYNINSAGVETLLGTTTVMSLDTWYRIDILLEFSPGAGQDGTLRIFINGILEVNAAIAAALGGMAQVDTHLQSTIDRWTGADALFEIDIDDWICADIPNKSGTESLDSIDWFFGSHVKMHNVNSASLTGWTGTQERMNQGTNPQQALGSSLTSTTSGAKADGITDLPTLEEMTEITDLTGLPICPIAAVVGCFSKNAGATDGKLGYNALLSGEILATINEQAVSQWFSKLYRPSGLTEPTDFAPFHVIKEKSADANLDTTDALQVTVEYVGVWGPEDDPEADIASRIGFLHNCRYPNTIWAQPLATPHSPVAIKGGTYVGNATEQSINLSVPGHFLIIRALTGGSAAITCFGAGLGGHTGINDTVLANSPVRMYIDNTGQAKFTVVGNNANINASGITYQYIVFCDPGMRYTVCDAYNYPATLTSRSRTLFHSGFLAKAGFVQKEILASGGGATGLSYKGPGNSGNDGQDLGGSAIANWGSFTTGILTTLLGIHYNTAAQVNLILWREQDDCGTHSCQIFSYTGDGAGGDRVITFPLASGRYPLLVMVIPHSGSAAFMRDPSHTGSNSCTINTLSNSITAIKAGGVDQITIGTTLNANGIVYEVFALMGGDVAWQNEEIIYPPCQPGWPDLPPTPPPPDVAVMGEGGITLGGDPPLTLLEDISGIYTLVPGKRNDTLYDRQTGQPNVDVEIPDPGFKTGFVGG